MANNVTKQEEYLKTLEINILSEEQYKQERDTGNLDYNAFYLTPDVIAPGAGTSSIIQLSHIENGNESYAPSGSAFGINTIAGVKGYHVIEVNGMQITVDDSDFDEDKKLVNNYVIGDILQFDATQHIYNKLEIISLNSNNAGQSVVTVKSLVDYDLDLSLDADPDENYCWVVGKYNGTIFPMARAAHTEGEGTKATARAAHAEGRDTVALGSCAHAEGRDTEAHYNAHAEGRMTLATSEGSHAEGRETKATGSRSHAQGYKTIASGANSDASGMSTVASGACSTAAGEGTIASGGRQFVIGAYNRENPDSNYAFIIGNGFTQSDGSVVRRNAVEVSWAGDANFVGSVISPRVALNYGYTEGSKDYAFVVGNGDITNPEDLCYIKKDGEAHFDRVTVGKGTLASGAYSFASGYNTKAPAEYSAAFGEGTIAKYKNQVVIGKYNRDVVQETIAFIIGGGTASNRKDVATISWSGDANFVRSVISPTIKLGSYYLHNTSDTSIAMVVGNGTSSVKSNSVTVYKNGDINSVGNISSERNIISHLAPTEDDHCTNKKYVDDKVATSVGDIEAALDNILAIQNQLIGGDSV